MLPDIFAGGRLCIDVVLNCQLPEMYRLVGVGVVGGGDVGGGGVGVPVVGLVIGMAVGAKVVTPPAPAHPERKTGAEMTTAIAK